MDSTIWERHSIKHIFSIVGQLRTATSAL